MKSVPATFNVLFLSVEVDPLVKVGGLGDVAGSLPPALNALPPEVTQGRRLDVRLVVPFHGAMRLEKAKLPCVAQFDVPSRQGPIPTKAYQTEVRGVTTYLISGPPIPSSSPTYSMDNRLNGQKFTYFSMAALELARALNWRVDVLHANDWHTALANYAVSRLRKHDPFFRHTKTLLTVHNLPFMGAGAESTLEDYDLPPLHKSIVPRWGRAFPLITGLMTSDAIVAVSPTYAKEIFTPEFGCDLMEMLASRADKISGILNGLDQNSWNPATDPALAFNFQAETLSQRANNKTALQREFGLDLLPDTPLIAMIGRLDQQKGVDLVPAALEELDDHPWQLILLGTGDPSIEAVYRQLEETQPQRVRSVLRFDAALSHRMYAGSDLLLMPSRYEPCGLAQMIAMRYGCVPVARATGGLRDTIIDNDDLALCTGFLFEHATAEDLADAIQRALNAYEDHPNWQKRQLNMMRQNFSWQKSAEAYARLYFNLFEEESKP